MNDAHQAFADADYFDGLTAAPRRVRLRIAGPRLLIEGDGISLAVAVSQVQWPERQRHGARIAHLAGGGSLQACDAASWDAWLRAAGRSDSLAVRLQQSWRGSLLAAALLLALVLAGYRWGLPLAARGVLAWVPASVDRQVGDAALASIDGRWLMASTLPPEQRQRIAAEFERAVALAYPPGGRPAYELQFRKSKLGPNAFALPGGTIVLTDEMVRLLDQREEVLMGVLGHELGHVRRRHSMRLFVQATLLGAVSSAAFGDFSGLLAGAPALLGHLDYSRDFEREADDEAIAVLRANGQSPALMVELFEALERQRKAKADKDGGEGLAQRLGIALSTHPADAERMQRFRDAARR
ncbi:MAG TPA: M48 family metallopeptidase [Methylibium sp.]